MEIVSRLRVQCFMLEDTGEPEARRDNCSQILPTHRLRMMSVEILPTMYAIRSAPKRSVTVIKALSGMVIPAWMSPYPTCEYEPA
jgi:hypothetical protein